MATNQIPTLQPPFLGHPIEICIVTPDLKQTLTGLCALGIGPFKIFHFNPSSVSEQTFRDEATPYDLDVAFAEQNDMVWEVMQPVSGPSLMREFLDRTGGRGGVHHVAFDCASTSTSGPSVVQKGSGPLVGEAAREEARRRRKEFEDRGFPLVQTGLWHGKNGTCEFMFFDTEGAIATCFESYVFSDDWEDPEEVEWFPPSK